MDEASYFSNRKIQQLASSKWLQITMLHQPTLRTRILSQRTEEAKNFKMILGGIESLPNQLWLRIRTKTMGSFRLYFSVVVV